MINYKYYGIFGESYTKNLDKKYAKNQGQFYKDIKSCPYHVMIDIAEIPWKIADSNIIKYKLAGEDCYERCQYATYAALKQNESKGNTRIKDADLAEEVNNLAHNSIRHITTVVNNDDKIYYDAKSHYVALASTYNAEKNIAYHIHTRLKRRKKPLDADIEKYRHGDIELTDEQMSMLEAVKNNRICMLNGAAGAGKTSTTNAILDMLDDCNKSYACMAFTGIASKQLNLATNRPSSTIHMFLTNPWQPDYVLIDEISTVSVHLLSRLLDAIGTKPNLIFIGDSAQLASISCGSLLRDITSYSAVPRVNLTKIFRYNTSGIVTIATDTRYGISNNLTKQYDDYVFIPTGSEPINQVVNVYDDLIKQGYTMDDILVLSPFNVGVGSNEINRRISDKYNAKKPINRYTNMKIGDKVINIKNQYGKNDLIANGEMGYLKRVSKSGCLVDFDFGERWIYSLENIKQAYSISVHKSQGSSAKIVIVLIDKSHGFMLSRNLLYTAITRARDKLYIIGDLDAIKNGLNVIEQDKRNTWLRDLLNN